MREPLKVAKSETYRHELLNWFHAPLRNYRGGDGRRYFRWALTGLEPIYRSLDNLQLSLFQRYVVQWIEIENRAMQFLDRFQKQLARDFCENIGPCCDGIGRQVNSACEIVALENIRPLFVMGTLHPTETQACVAQVHRQPLHPRRGLSRPRSLFQQRSH